MSTVRAIDGTGDWTFGKGKNDYLSGNDAIAQNIATRLRSFLGDCFFDLTAGIDWFNLLGRKNQLALELQIKTVIFNTDGVTGLITVATLLDGGRTLTVTYNVQTVFSKTGQRSVAVSVG